MTEREINIGYYDTQKQYINSLKIHLQQALDQLWSCKIVPLDTIQEELKPFDLIVVVADHIPQEEFEQWLIRCEATFKTNNLVWTPALLIADLDQSHQISLMHKIISRNWYFDIVAPSHINSIIVRIANLIRIHDHLKELYNYETILHDLRSQVDTLENTIKQGHPSGS